MKNHKAACDLADQALQDALDKIDELEEDDFRDAKSIIELLKENLTLWKEEDDDDNDNAVEDLWGSWTVTIQILTFLCFNSLYQKHFRIFLCLLIIYCLIYL